MSPRKKSRSRKKKKKSSKGKIIGIILLLMIIGFSVWTYPSEYTTEYSISTITQETKTFNFNVKMFHSVVIMALARKLMIISVACIFALLRDAFDGHVTVRVTTRAIDDRFFSPLTFSQVPLL